MGDAEDLFGAGFLIPSFELERVQKIGESFSSLSKADRLLMPPAHPRDEEKDGPAETVDESLLLDKDRLTEQAEKEEVARIECLKRMRNAHLREAYRLSNLIGDTWELLGGNPLEKKRKRRRKKKKKEEKACPTTPDYGHDEAGSPWTGPPEKSQSPERTGSRPSGTPERVAAASSKGHDHEDSKAT